MNITRESWQAADAVMAEVVERVEWQKHSSRVESPATKEQPHTTMKAIRVFWYVFLGIAAAAAWTMAAREAL